MKTNKCRWGVGVVASVILVACGATLLPQWTVDLDNFPTIGGYLYQSADSDSVYLVSMDYQAINAQLLQLDLQGNILQQWDESVQEDITYDKNEQLFKLSSDKAIWVGKNPDVALFIDPQNGVMVTGFQGLNLASNQRLEIADVGISQAEQLVFTASLTEFTDPDNSKQRISTSVTGIVDSNGDLVQLNQYPDRKSTRIYPRLSGSQFVAFIVYPDDPANPDAHTKVIQLLDHDLNVLNEQVVSLAEADFFLNDFQHDHFLGYLRENGKPQGRKIALSLEGNIEEAQYDGPASDRYATTQGYFETDMVLSNRNTICYYNNRFQRQWCRIINPANDSLQLESVHITDNEDLAFSVTTSYQTLLGVNIAVEQIPNTFLLGVIAQVGVNAQGEDRRRVVHYIYNQLGVRVQEIEEPSYYKRGKLTRCFFSYCVEPEVVQPGACSAYAATVLPGNQLLSVSGYCPDASGRWIRRASLWQW